MISILKTKNISTSYKATVFNFRENHYDFKSCSESIEYNVRVAVIGNNVLIHTLCTLILMKTPEGKRMDRSKLFTSIKSNAKHAFVVLSQLT